jgi:hypothetical protein
MLGPVMRYSIQVNDEEIDHADSLAEARRARGTIIYGGIGAEANTTIKPVRARVSEPNKSTSAPAGQGAS